jgi:hypothetical protein
MLPGRLRIRELLIAYEIHWPLVHCHETTARQIDNADRWLDRIQVYSARSVSAGSTAAAWRAGK